MPVFLSEYGCNIVRYVSRSCDRERNSLLTQTTIRPRTFTEIKALYTPPMLDVFSGGVMYQYSEEANHYGIVQVHSDNSNNNNNNRTTLPDYDYFQRAMAQDLLDGSDASDLPAPSSSTTTPPIVACPTMTDDWQVNAAALPPPPSRARCDCLQANARCSLQPDLLRQQGDDDAVVAGRIGAMIAQICGSYGGGGGGGDGGDNNDNDSNSGAAKGPVHDACQAISDGDASRALYSVFGGCDPASKLAYVADALVQQQQQQGMVVGGGCEQLPSMTTNANANANALAKRTTAQQDLKGVCGQIVDSAASPPLHAPWRRRIGVACGGLALFWWSQW